MRSVTNLAKVEGHASLVRDMSSNAIISTNEADYQAYKNRRELEKKRQQTIDNQLKEIECIKSEMNEIKQLLSMLISDKG